MKSIPFLRIIIPFILGLYLAFEMASYIDPLVLKVSFCTLLILCVLFLILFKHKTVSLIIFDLVMINLAIVLVHLSSSHLNPNSLINQVKSNEEIVYLASLEEVPIEKQNFVKCQLNLSELIFKQKSLHLQGKLIAYFRKSSKNDQLKPGNILLIKSKLLRVPSIKNPFEFDYAAYLNRKEIYFTTFVDEAYYRVYNEEKSNLNFLSEQGLKIKFHLINLLRQNFLNKDAFSICSALITGYDDEIDKTIVNAFAHSGTLHILSVSGLHVGLIYLMLSFIFNLIDRHNHYKGLRFALISLLLWVFALITGFSPPVLRAVLMFNFLGIGKIFYRTNTNNQLNVLLFTAFLLLVYNPNLIFDIGFLLSYSAMIGIIVFTPKMLQWVQFKNKILIYFYESIAVSVAATIATLPLTLYYFKQFPYWFFVCNLVVVPLSFLILILAFASLFKLSILIHVVNLLVAWMLDFIKIFNHEHYAYIDFIHFRLRDALFLFSLIFCIYFLFQKRQYSFVVFTFILLISWQLSCLFDAYKAKQSKLLTVYQIKNKSILLLKNRTLAHYNHFDSLSFNYSMKPHFTSFNHASMLVSEFNYAKTQGVCCLLLNKPDFLPRVNFEEVNTLVIANNFKLQASQIQQFKHIKMVVLDGSNQANIIYKTENLCRKFGIPFHSTYLNGAYTMALE